MVTDGEYLAVVHGPTDVHGAHHAVAGAVLRTNARQVIELGVRGGNTTTMLLWALQRTGGRLWSCDIRQDPSAYPYLNDEDGWEFVLGDDRFVADRAPVSCDVLLVDTSHEEEHTRAELELYGPRVRPGGVILMHDADLPGVMMPAVEWALERGHRVVVHPCVHGLVEVQV